MDPAQLQQIRRFNRVVTQRVGALEGSYLRRGRPLAEARLIFEVGARGSDVRSLRDALGLDTGYLNRLLRSLEAQGLVQVHKQAEDGRVRRVTLTPDGEAELAAYDELSDKLAESILAPLDAARRDRLVTAMAEIERLIRTAAVEASIEAPESAEARWCLQEYFRELAERFDTGFDPEKSNPARDEDMVPPAGYFVLARLDGYPVGCGVLKRKDRTTGEIKRMWTASSARGRGVARKVLQVLESIARESGFTTLHLETNRTLIEAQTLYRKEGYREVARFNDEPYAHHWFEKKL